MTFVKHTLRWAWPTLLGPARSVRSRLDCAIHCLQSFPSSCHGYLYNESTKICKPSSGLSPYSSPEPSDGDFYFNDSQSSYPDFRHHTLLNETQSVSAYAGYFTKPLTYTEAQATCQSMHSHLFVAKSVIKYFLFLNITTKEYSDWIGLDDLANEGRFVWADDGQEIDVYMKSYLFVSPQPDGQRNENCVYKTSIHDTVKALTFNDANCSLTFSYVCEVDLSLI
ncbi:uncharacterized protein LOC106078340 isoform X2 [Biomphalaria glabrata]|nr:uncharacterized protein LOC106078340 isoform X2 [Biomphalaria glabrata]XP_055896951.1 uncharacterized protein LOC106078340 isoform X2 [Biomphalaria glabrata]